MIRPKGNKCSVREGADDYDKGRSEKDDRGIVESGERRALSVSRKARFAEDKRTKKIALFFPGF